jgi:hypothetical protein
VLVPVVAVWAIACSKRTPPINPPAGKSFLAVLTPNWNREHENRLHLELMTHDWVLVR